MPLESCMIIIDNSEFTRNGDYTPTRFQAQAQAVAAVFTAKTDMNPESSVGLLTMAGKSPSLLVTPTNDIGKLLSSLSRSAISGTADPITAIQVAQLALKHRENKNARQRVVVFAGSEISIPASELVKLGKKLRKNNVLIDVVLFGDEAIEGEEGWRGLIEAAGGGESHLVTVPPGPQLLSDVIQTSPILFDSDFAQTHGGAAGDGEGGVSGGDGMDLDPNMDPELAMAIRMSLQEAEEQARREAAASGSSTTATGETSASASAATSNPTPAVDASATALASTQTAPLVNTNATEAPAPGDQHPASNEDDEDEDAEMQRAMQMSLNPSGDVNMEEADEEDEEDEDAAIAAAIAMSLEHEKGEDQDKGTNPPK